MAPVPKAPRILLFDIETSPNLAWMWNKYEQNAVGDFIKERMIICFAWKFLGDKEVKTASVVDYYGYQKNFLVTKNRKLIDKLHNVMSSADIIVAQNGDNFDVKMANAEFIQYGLTPTPPYKTVDTLKIARSKFKFNSNRLDDIGARLQLGRKVKTGGFDLWLGCLRGEKASWDKMLEYNKQDVVLLEQIYLKLRPWMPNHPNMNVFDGKSACPTCRGTHLQSRGWMMAVTGRRRRWRCMNPKCGKWSYGKFEKSGTELR